MTLAVILHDLFSQASKVVPVRGVVCPNVNLVEKAVAVLLLGRTIDENSFEV